MKRGKGCDIQISQILKFVPNYENKRTILLMLLGFFTLLIMSSKQTRPRDF